MLTRFPSSESGCNPNVFSTIVQRFLTRVFHSSSYYNFRFSRLLSASYSTQNNHRFATNFPHPSRILDTILNPIRRIYIYIYVYMYCVKRFREMNFSVISRGSWSRGKGPATSCQEFHFKLVDLGNKERQRSMTGRRMLHPFRGWNFYPTINSKEETQFSRSRKIIRLSSQVYIYICMYEVCIFSIVLKRFNGIVERFTSHEYISIEPLIKHERDIGKKLFHVPIE